MTVVKSWSGDGLTAGVLTNTTAGTGDTPFNGFQGDPGGTYPNVVASGPRSPQLEFPTANSKSAAPYWTLASALTKSAGRFYVTTPAAWNSVAHSIAQINVDAATIGARISLAGTGSPGQLRTYNNASVQTAASAGGALSLSTQYRIEWTLDQTTASAGVLTVKCYAGDSATEMFTLTSTSTYGASASRVIFGAYNYAAVPLMQFDDFAVADTNVFIGSKVAAPPPPPPPPPPAGPTIKVWNGTALVSATRYVWNGTALVAV